MNIEEFASQPLAFDPTPGFVQVVGSFAGRHQVTRKTLLGLAPGEAERIFDAWATEMGRSAGGTLSLRQWDGDKWLIIALMSIDGIDSKGADQGH